MKIKNSLIVLVSLWASFVFAQEKTIEVFKDTRVNFAENTNVDGIRLQQGRVVVKKISVPQYKKGTDVSIRVRVRSNGDSWDKSGSCFVVKDLKTLNLMSVALDNQSFPETSSVEKSKGVIASQEYTPAVELLRFMTPFGVGFYSDEQKYPSIRYGRPVSVPVWENEVVWTQDISQLESLVTGEFYVGVWIDTWTEEGFLVDVSLSYSGRPRPKKNVIPLANTIYYISGQSIPDFFAQTTLKTTFSLPKNVTDAQLFYITTGHGGHHDGDEFVKKQNTLLVDNKQVLSFIPWRDDCAAFRRFNPSSGVWVQKDTATYYNEKGEYIKQEITERLASSDLSRSNWCPGAEVVPERIHLKNLSKGNHTFEIKIPATSNKGNQLNHWLVSAYLVY